MKPEKETKKHRVTLLVQRGGPTDTSVEVYISEAEDLIMEGYDIGVGPEAFYDKSDYEYVVTVKQKHKDELLVRLIQHVFSELKTPTSGFMQWLRDHDIPFEFDTW